MISISHSDFYGARQILKILQDKGHNAYIVGGAVRDYTLGKVTEDIDITTSATPEEVSALFRKTIPVGLSHGTVVVRHCHHSYEITTFRKESDYKDHRRPSYVAFVSSLHEDLGRRDFTINAMAMSLHGDIIDPFDGRNDIEHGVLRTVGQAQERFQEDPLRMMRAIRFTSQLSFGIEKNTLQALNQWADDLSHISVERIRDEFEKLLMGDDIRRALLILVNTGLYAYLPGLSDKKEQLQQAARFDVNPSFELIERWAFVCFIVGEIEPSSWLRKWKLSNRSITAVTSIVQALNLLTANGFTNYQMYKSGYSSSRSATKLYALLQQEQDERHLHHFDEAYRRLPIKQRDHLHLTGNDLLSWFEQKPGPWVSQCIEDIEKAVIAGDVSNEKGEIKNWILSRH